MNRNYERQWDVNNEMQVMECETKGEQKMLGDVRELISHTLQKRGGCFDRCVCGQLSCYNLSWYSKDMWNIIIMVSSVR